MCSIAARTGLLVWLFKPNGSNMHALQLAQFVLKTKLTTPPHRLNVVPHALFVPNLPSGNDVCVSSIRYMFQSDMSLLSANYTVLYSSTVSSIIPNQQKKPSPSSVISYTTSSNKHNNHLPRIFHKASTLFTPILL